MPAAKSVELRYFAGLGHGEVATALNITVYQARLKWSYARAWLQPAFPWNDMSIIPAETNSSTGAKSVMKFIRDIRERVATVVVGQDVVVERLLISLFTGNQILLQGDPGIAKTLLASVLSKSIDLEFSRVQFTIDLLPSDILGLEILDQRTNEFRINKGPIFTNLLLADEINRAFPKVQGALLEAMQEPTT